MIFNPAPIVTEPDQPDCFEYALLQLETKMLIKSLTWKSDRVLRLINSTPPLGGTPSPRSSPA